MRAPPGLRRVAVMAGQPVERELQHDFGRTRRPGAFAFDILEAFEETADVKQKAGEFRTDRIERLMHALARGDHRFGECAARSPPAPRRSDDIGLAQFEVVRGIRLARVKSARSRSPACNWCGSI